MTPKKIYAVGALAFAVYLGIWFLLSLLGPRSDTQALIALGFLVLFAGKAASSP